MTSPEQATTPKRRRIAGGANQTPTTPASPAVRALSGLRSWLSPWRGNRARSAAFGVEDEDEAQEQGHDASLDQGRQTQQHSNGFSSTTANGRRSSDQADNDVNMYPSLPAQSNLPKLPPMPPTQALSPPSNSASGDQAYPFTFTPPSRQRLQQSANPFTTTPKYDPAPAYASQTAFHSAASPPLPPAIPQQTGSSASPLSRNYQLLARFFADKAAEEAGASTAGHESRLTEDEVRGCWTLIEESGRSLADVKQALGLDEGSEYGSQEVPRRRGRADQVGQSSVRRSWLSPAPATHDRPYAYSQSPSLGASRLGEGTRFGHLSNPEPHTGYESSVPASRFPNSGMVSSSTDSALFARSLVGQGNTLKSSPSNPFLTGSSTGTGLRSQNSAAPRRRKPIYLGPGMSTSRSAFSLNNARRAAPLGSRVPEAASQQPVVGLGKRQRLVEPDEDAQMGDVRTEESTSSSSSLWNEGSRDIAALPQSQSSVSLHPSLDRPVASQGVAKASQPPATGSSESPVRQTRTASAVLSILAQSDSPKLPVSRPKPTVPTTQQSKTRSQRSNGGDLFGGESTFRPDSILNPYQAAPALNLAASATAKGKSRSAEAIEKMKDERRRSSRLRKGSEAPAQSSGPGLLETIERSKPSGSESQRRGGSRAREGSVAAKDTAPPAEVPATPPRNQGNTQASSSTTPTSTPPTKTSEEKTAEARRRLESINKLASPPSATSQAASTTSFSFANVHAPSRPSRLSMAFNADESPSSKSSTEDEREDRPAAKRKTIREEADEEEADQSIQISKPVAAAKGFNFFASGTTPSVGNADKVQSSLKTSSPAASTFSFSAPAVGADTTQNKSAPASTPAFSFTKPAVADPVSAGPSTQVPPPSTKEKPSPSLSFRPAPIVVNKSNFDTTMNPAATTSTDPRSEALAKSKASLPTFDLQVSWTASFAGPSKQSQDEALKTSAADLPKFDLSSTLAVAAKTPSSSSTNGSAPSNGFTFAKSSSSSSGSSTGFNFNQPATPAAVTPTSIAETTSTPVSATASSTEAATEGGEGQQEESSPSALLGSGQGEEDEVTLFEIRSKFWKFVDGKWIDLGIGLSKVKKSNSSSIRRLLVRNVGNGSVMINFRLFEGFEVKQDGGSLSFTGFDQDGKGVPMRCKVKAAEGAKEFKGWLEKEGGP